MPRHKYDPKDFLPEIHEWLGNGKTLRSYCRQKGKPSYGTVYDWIEQGGEDVASRFGRARDMGEDVISQECLDIADDDSRDVSGELEMPNGVAVQRDRLRIETRLKLLAKWNPKKWGDKISQEVTGADGAPLLPSITIRLVKPNAE